MMDRRQTGFRQDMDKRQAGGGENAGMTQTGMNRSWTRQGPEAKGGGQKIDMG